MKVYFDICCLKRPFDSQDQALVRLEAEAVTTILAVSADRISLIRTSAQLLENALNPVQWRRDAVSLWLASGPLVNLTAEPLARRTSELMELGFGNFDAFHLASSEAAGADVFLTVDDRLLKKAQKPAAQLRVRVASPLAFVQEVSEWKT